MNYLEDFERKMSIKYALSTKNTYKEIIKLFLLKYPEPKECSAKQIEEYLLTHKSNSRHRQVRGVLQYFFTILFEQEFKFKNIPYPPKQFQLPKVIDQSYLLEKISKIENLKHKCIISLSYGCGLRLSELISIQLTDIDSKRMLVHIRKGKGMKDRQTMLPKTLLDNLRNYYKEYKPKQFLFEGQFGGQYSKRSIQKIVKLYIGKEYSPHKLRHSFATHLHEHGTDIKDIKELLGHTNLKTTEIYTHVSTKHISKIKSPIEMNIV